MKELLEEISASMRMNRLRTFLTGFAIAWGIFMLVVLLSIGNGFNHGIKSKFGSMNVNSYTIYPSMTSMPYKGFKPWRIMKMTEEDYEYLRKHLTNYTDIAPVLYNWGGSMSNGKRQTDVRLVGTNDEYNNIYRKKLTSGRFINKIDLEEKRKVAVISERDAKSLLGSAEEAIGKFVQLKNGINFRVIGVLKDDGSYTSNTYLPYTIFNTIYNPSGKVGQIAIATDGLKTEEDGDKYEAKIRSLLQPRLMFHPDDRQALWVNNTSKSYSMVQKVFGGISAFIWIIAIGTLISGVVGVGNIMLVTVKERTREFGIRKALGATPKNILGAVVAESLMITTIFGYIGMLLGIGASELIGMAVENSGGEKEGIMSMMENPSVDLQIVAAATIVLIIAGTIAGYIPAKKAVKIKPVEAMAAK